MSDIAKKLNVSTMTVSKAFQNSPDISLQVKEKVLKTASELGYVYSKGEPIQLLILFSEAFSSKEEMFYSSAFKRINNLAMTKNIQTSTVLITKEEENKLAIPFANIKADAIIIMGQFSKEYVKEVIKVQPKTVLFDFFYYDLELDSVVTDNYFAGYIATQYLIDLGYQNIGFVGTLNTTMSIDDRYMGYSRALVQANYPIDKKYIVNDRNENNQIIDFKLPSKLPEAFVCNNDYTAYLLIQKLSKASYRVPEDISIISFDDVIYSQISSPPITTIKVSRNDMANETIKLILRRIKNPSIWHRRVTMSVRIIERESVKRRTK